MDDLKQVRNIDLLKRLRDSTISGELCLRSNKIDVHGHFHTTKQLESEILSRMIQPSVIKLEVNS